MGAVASKPAPVVNIQTYGLARPAPVVIVAVKVVPALRLAAGVKIAFVHVASQVTAPATFVPPPVSVKVAVVTFVEVKGLLKDAIILSLMRTPVARFAGVEELTVAASRFTVNVCGPLVPFALVTVTFWAPTAAFPAMVNVAVIDVLLATVALLRVMPVPLRPIVDADPKFVPVSVTGTACPCVPELALIEVSVGVGGGV